MNLKKYSAGIISKSFWFLEFSGVVKLINENYSYEDIKKKAIDDNLFGAAKVSRARQIFSGVSARTRALDKELTDIFCNGDMACKKLINTIAIMKTDRLFFEFVYEVYSEKILIGDLEIANRDISQFFRNKEGQDEKIASWSETTIGKIKAGFINYLCEAGLLERLNKKRIIKPPLMDLRLEKYLIGNGQKNIYNALLGVRL